VIRDLVAQARLVWPYLLDDELVVPMRYLVAYPSLESASNSPDWPGARRDCARCWRLRGSSSRCRACLASGPDWLACWHAGKPLRSSSAAAPGCAGRDGITHCTRGNGDDDRIGRPSPVLSHAELPESTEKTLPMTTKKMKKIRKGEAGKERKKIPTSRKTDVQTGHFTQFSARP